MSEKASRNKVNDKELQDLIDQRIEEKKEEIKKEAKKEAKKEIQDMRPDSNRVVDNSKANGISRREFLKKAGWGSVGLAVLGLSPASALNLKSDSLNFSDSNTSYLDIDTVSNEVSIDNADLRLNDRNITGIGELELPTDEASSDDRIWLDASEERLKVKIGGEVYVSKVQPAIPGATVVDFESGNLNAFRQTTNYSITTNNVVEGSNALSIDDPENNEFIYSLSGDGLDYYPQKGDKFSCMLYEEGPLLPGFGFGLFEDSTAVSGYAVFAHQDADDLIINRYDDGSNTTLKRPNVTLDINTWYDYEVQWHDGTGSQPDNTIEVTIYEIDTAVDLSSELGRVSEVFNTTVSDSTYPNNRGVGFAKVSTNTGVRIADRYWYLGNVD